MTGSSVVFVINSLELGGAERVLTLLANNWAKAGWRVSIVTLRSDSPPFYPLDRSIEHISLGVGATSFSAWQALVNNITRISRIRRAIRRVRPDVVISFMAATNVVTILATRFMGIPILASERTLPSASMAHPVWRFLIRLTYPLADVLVVQSSAARDEFGPALRKRARIIPNPVLHRVGHPRTHAPAKSQRYLISIGRLEPVKRLDHLIKAFAIVADEHPEWTLVIAGDGSLRRNLEELAGNLGMADRIEFVGPIDDPIGYLMKADVFVMASRYEGMPNSLLEAMACGLSVITYDCPGGIKDIVEDGRNGVLVESGNVDALSRAIASLLKDPERRSRLGEAARAVKDHHSLARITGLWEKEVEFAIEGAGRP